MIFVVTEESMETFLSKAQSFEETLICQDEIFRSSFRVLVNLHGVRNIRWLLSSLG